MGSNFLAQKYQQGFSTPLGNVDELASRYEDIINLSLGDPDFKTADLVINASFQDAQRGYTSYAEALGDRELRRALIEFYLQEYGLGFKLNELMSVVGATHGMYLVLQAVLDEGDEVIIPEPYFTPYEQQVALAGGKAIFLETKEEDGFKPDIKKLEAIITDKTKVLLLNSPNNPTGAVLDLELLKQIASLARRKDLLLISDDVYSAFTYNTSFVPIASLPGMKERTVIIGSFSKNYAMTGWRIGYVLAPAYIINCIKEINEAVCYSAPTISQRAALEALRVRKQIQAALVSQYRERINYAYQLINSIPKLSVLKPEGGFYLFVNIQKTGLSSRQLAQRILEEAHVLVLPGDSFGKSGEGYLRIACTVGKDRLKEAFSRIAKMELFQEKGIENEV